MSAALSTNWRWPHFTRGELSCKCGCGEYYHWPAFLDGLERMRFICGHPLRLTSGHRCKLHNARIGGAPLSQHLSLAADVAILNYDRHALLSAAQQVGFTGIGLYQDFLHIDLGRKRSWDSGAGARRLWKI